MFTKIFQPVLLRHHRCKVTEVKHSVQKEKRIIDTLEPVMNQHRLIVDERVVRKDEKRMLEDKNYSLFYQMTRLTKARGALKHDDRLDSVAIGVAHWLDSMARDEQDSISAHNEEEMREALDKFVRFQVLRGRTDEQQRGTLWHSVAR